jgi:hypothetical protein
VAMTLQEQDGRPRLVGDVPPDLDYYAPAGAWREVPRELRAARWRPEAGWRLTCRHPVKPGWASRQWAAAAECRILRLAAFCPFSPPGPGRPKEVR